MSVYTTVSSQALEKWLEHYGLPEPVALEPIAEGITNSNYFVIWPDKKLVLTLLETIPLEEAQIYLQLIHHFATHRVPCPLPLIDQEGRFVSLLSGKPACLVQYLTGKAVDNPTPPQCYAVGKMLATLHEVGQHFPHRLANPRSINWWNHTALELYSVLSLDEAALLRNEIDFQNQHQPLLIPCGIIHADLFKDNVLMQGTDVAGFIDFYYACYDYLLYDIAIMLNSWAQRPNGEMDDALALALLAGYQHVRLLQPTEVMAWPVMLRAAALRFWLSRLQDMHYPTPGALTYIKDPQVFRTILSKHRERSSYWL